MAYVVAFQMSGLINGLLLDDLAEDFVGIFNFRVVSKGLRKIMF